MIITKLFKFSVLVIICSSCVESTHPTFFASMDLISSDSPENQSDDKNIQYAPTYSQDSEYSDNDEGWLAITSKDTANIVMQRAFHRLGMETNELNAPIHFIEYKDSSQKSSDSDEGIENHEDSIDMENYIIPCTDRDVLAEHDIDRSELHDSIEEVLRGKGSNEYNDQFHYSLRIHLKSTVACYYIYENKENW